MRINDLIKNNIENGLNINDFSDEEKLKVLTYIKNKKYDIKVFAKKYYDIIKNAFFTYEYKLEKDNSHGFILIKSEFNNFKDFYIYVDGKIYENTCMYGYEFSKEEKETYSIDINKVNFDSLITYSLDSKGPLSLLQELKKNVKEKNKKILKVQNYLEHFNSVSSYTEYRKYKKRISEIFVSGIESYFDSTVNFILSSYNFPFLKDYFANDILSEGNQALSIENYYLMFGLEDTINLINNMNSFSQSQKNKKRKFLKLFENFDTSQLEKNTSTGFDNNTYLYYEKVSYKYGNALFGKKIKYFFDFISFKNYLNNDLSNCLLSFAPLEETDYKECKINENTKLPFAYDKLTYKIRKYYQYEKFYVDQEFRNEDDIVVIKNSEVFEAFFDFVHFLGRDLSKTDFGECDGIINVKNIKNLIFDNCQIKSTYAKALNIKYEKAQFLDNISSLDLIEKNEIAVLEPFDIAPIIRPFSYNYISYVTDIHMQHKLKKNNCESIDDVNYYLNTIVKEFKQSDFRFVLIGGDITDNFSLYKTFINKIKGEKSNLKKYFITLGNHELWGFEGKPMNEIVHVYKDVIDDKNVYLVHNNLFYIKNYSVCEITYDELILYSIDKIKAILREAQLIIFGGIGFSGQNDIYNADIGLYRNTISRLQEKEESNKFYNLYVKVSSACKGKNTIIFTHMGLSNWSPKNVYEDKYIYIYGHDHRNYYYDDGDKRIYGDNQAGYFSKGIYLKYFDINFGYDYFQDYDNGIYEIDRNEYISFFRGINVFMNFNRQYKKLFMLKRSGLYMFFLQMENNKLMLLNGGNIKSADKPLEYYYENMIDYSNSIKGYLVSYNEFMKKVSEEVKQFGGSGNIHGCIVDIDYFNHLYINPLDYKITPYYATSMVYKYVYKNISSLLKYERPDIYENIINKKGINQPSILTYSLETRKTTTMYYDTDIYRISRVIKSLNFISEHNVIRTWNDGLINTPSLETGKKILSNILGIESLNNED